MTSTPVLPAQRVIDLDTVRGPARALLTEPAPRSGPAARSRARSGARSAAASGPVALALLLHGAGSGVDGGGLPELAAALARGGMAVAALEQPYRVAGRRAPDRAPVLDAVVLDVVALLRAELGASGCPLVVAGRSSGARVACRTRAQTQAAAVVALGFPWRPPRGGPDRGEELAAAGRLGPVLVVQGRRDPFGCPPVSPGVAVVVVPGAHTPGPASAALAARWLLRVVSGPAGRQQGRDGVAPRLR